MSLRSLLPGGSAQAIPIQAIIRNPEQSPYYRTALADYK
jgi:hypothetical protein